MNTPNFTRDNLSPIPSPSRGTSDNKYRDALREWCPSWLARIRGVLTLCGRKSNLPVMTVSQRVAYRLTQIEIREPDAWFRDDLRIARLTVFFASNGNPDPWRFAFWWYLGTLPEKLIPFFVARAESDAGMEAEARGVTRGSNPATGDTPPTQPLPPKKAAQRMAQRKAAA